MTPTQWINNRIGTYVEWDNNEAKNQCVDAVKCYVEECFGVITKGRGTSPWGMAKDYYLYFDETWWGGYKKFHDAGFVKFKNTLEFVPMYGDIVVWKKPSDTGHIAIVKTATKHSITSIDQNYGSDKRISLKAHNDNYDGVLGFLRPPRTVRKDVNVRKGPGTSYKVSKELKAGTKVTVYEMINGWAKIGTGLWVSANYLESF